MASEEELKNVRREKTKKLADAGGHGFPSQLRAEEPFGDSTREASREAFVKLALRAIAFCRQARRVVGGQASHQQQDARSGCHGGRMTLNEPRGAVPDRVGPGADRLLTEQPPQILGKRAHRAVALGRLLLERLGDYGVQVSAQGAAQPGWRGPAPGCVARKRFLRLGARYHRV